MTGAIAYVILGLAALVFVGVVGTLGVIALVKLARPAKPAVAAQASAIEYRQPSAVDAGKVFKAHVDTLAWEHFLAGAGKAEASNLGKQFAQWSAGTAAPADAPKS